MFRLSKTIGLLLVILLMFSMGSAQASEAQSFYESIPDYEVLTSPDALTAFFDSLTATEISSLRDAAVLFVGPFILNFIMMWYVFNKVLKMAEASLTPGETAETVELTTTGQRASMTMAVFASFVISSQIGLFSPLVSAVALAAVMISAYFTQSDEEEDEIEKSSTTFYTNLDSGGL